ncbi:MAG: hypothetical protein ACYSWU_16335 [Planctomycetota bacterium]|jgi:hypothetical protein
MVAENVIKFFGMNNLLIESGLRRVEKEYGVDLGRHENPASDKDDKYYPQFDERVRREASSMSRHYEVFYCLEKSIRTLIREKLEDSIGGGLVGEGGS